KGVGWTAIGQVAFDDVVAVVAANVEGIASRGGDRRQQGGRGVVRHVVHALASDARAGRFQQLFRLSQGCITCRDEFVDRGRRRLLGPGCSQVEYMFVAYQRSQACAVLGVEEIEKLHGVLYQWGNSEECVLGALDCSTATYSSWTWARARASAWSASRRSMASMICRCSRSESALRCRRAMVRRR